ncbi:MAG: type II toxin-antitoxin system HicB family antitoxin [Verrucomicrobiales bacterium]|jgi:predicted RNase H-like HicB family nuclease|nr:type II toxin-antitoxin system HicB family antitoxin [Verrucomicrobiales bacterium]
MQYPIVVIENEEGFAAGCPALPGCWTQGATHQEAVDNIREAISLWLEVEEEDLLNECQSAGVTYLRETVTV